jgi:hypothetical protein
MQIIDNAFEVLQLITDKLPKTRRNEKNGGLKTTTSPLLKRPTKIFIFLENRN